MVPGRSPATGSDGATLDGTRLPPQGLRLSHADAAEELDEELDEE
ncbi:hypothetical protein Q427_10980 [Halomonas sp. BC04]|nr:hypothetical protein Q427_10980 [Halomonas sp. BC04]